MTEIIPTIIPDVQLIRPRKFGDGRGFFSETYNKRVLAAAGINFDFVQDNHSLSVEKGTIRGLHFQTPPYAQAKLIRVVKGAVFDVAVDLRKNSSTFRKHVATTLSADAWNQLYLPIGFAHGFMTLEPHTEVIYKVTNYYAPEYERGILWNDPALGIPWPHKTHQAMLSDKDKMLPLFSELVSVF